MFSKVDALPHLKSDAVIQIYVSLVKRIVDGLTRIYDTLPQSELFKVVSFALFSIFTILNIDRQ